MNVMPTPPITVSEIERAKFIELALVAKFWLNIEVITQMTIKGISIPISLIWNIRFVSFSNVELIPLISLQLQNTKGIAE